MYEWLSRAVASVVHSPELARCPTCHQTQVAGFWLMVGFVGQAIFTARFLAQWLVSERRKASVVPVAFWWLSLAGGGLLLLYAVRREDPVIVVGQSLGLWIYLRNLMLVARAGTKAAGRTQAPAGRAARPAARFLAQGAVEPTLKRLRFDQDHAWVTPAGAQLPLHARLRAREDAL